MIVPPLPCPVRPRRSSSCFRRRRPGEFEQFGAARVSFGGSGRTTLAGERPGAGRGSGPATHTDWLRRRRSRTVLIEPEAVSRCA